MAPQPLGQDVLSRERSAHRSHRAAQITLRLGHVGHGDRLYRARGRTESPRVADQPNAIGITIAEVTIVDSVNGAPTRAKSVKR